MLNCRFHESKNKANIICFDVIETNFIFSRFFRVYAAVGRMFFSYLPDTGISRRMRHLHFILIRKCAPMKTTAKKRCVLIDTKRHMNTTRLMLMN